MEHFYLVIIILVLFITNFSSLQAKTDLPGKKLFYTAKGKYGSCNYCHKDGTSAGRWDFEYEELNEEEGKKIPSLKGIGKKKSVEQIEREVKYMKKLFKFELTDDDVKALAEYVSGL